MLEKAPALNLSLYGYPFETTPRLSKLIEKIKNLSNLIEFMHPIPIQSTHYGVRSLFV